MEQNGIKEFAKKLSNITGQLIGEEHIHTTTEGRYYYIQAPVSGSPMLLHHYRGPFFVDMSLEDYENIKKGNVSVDDYIQSANWLVGYYWGGGSMVSGGYYQPVDILGNNEELRRYLNIMSCRGMNRASGYVASKEECTNCSVNNCPFSRYKIGNWAREFKEYDPRIDFFNALLKRFELEFPGFTLRGFLYANIPDAEIWVNPIGHYDDNDPYAFTVYASENVIRDLMMHKVEPSDWDEYVNNFTFRVKKTFLSDAVDATIETVQNCFVDDNTVESNSIAKINAKLEKPISLLARFVRIFKK